jgi:hypothetical protein
MVSICLQAFLTYFHEIDIHTQKLFFRTVLNFCSNVVFEFINSVRVVSIYSVSTHYIIEINKMMYMILLIKVYENLIHGLATCRWARTSYITAAAWHKDVWNALHMAWHWSYTGVIRNHEQCSHIEATAKNKHVIKIFTSYSLSHMQTCVKILKFTLNFKISFYMISTLHVSIDMFIIRWHENCYSKLLHFLQSISLIYTMGDTFKVLCAAVIWFFQ